MKVNEIFYSIQGEGKLSGMPSVFVRTAGCRLRCSWCDTKYSLTGADGKRMTTEQIVGEVLKHPTRFCVLTGGDPMIAPGINDLAAELKRHERHITIETSGTVAPSGIQCDLASISPKLRSSVPTTDDPVSRRHDAERWQPEVIRQWMSDYPYQLKFVICDELDLKEMDELLEELSSDIPPENVLLMPEGVDHKTLEMRSGIISEACKLHGYRYCPRLHVDLYQNRPGH